MLKTMDVAAAIRVATVVAVLLLLPPTALAQTGTKVVPVAPTTRSADLAALPDTQMLVFPNGLRMSAGQLRGLAPRQRAQARGSEMLRAPPPGPVVAVTRNSSLAQLENAPPQTVLQLPDGRRITAAQLKAVDEALAKTKATPARAGPGAPQVVRVPRGTPIAQMLARPDSDILESPAGKRVTVGELRRYLDTGPSGAKTQSAK